MCWQGWWDPLCLRLHDAWKCEINDVWWKSEWSDHRWRQPQNFAGCLAQVACKPSSIQCFQMFHLKWSYRNLIYAFLTAVSMTSLTKSALWTTNSKIRLAYNVSATNVITKFVFFCTECGNFRLPHSVQKNPESDWSPRLAESCCLLLAVHFQLSSLSRLLSKMHKLNYDMDIPVETFCNFMK